MSSDKGTRDDGDMEVNRHVRQNGNSLAVNIPRLLFGAVGLSQDDPVEVVRRPGRGVLEIRPVESHNDDDGQQHETEADD